MQFFVPMGFSNNPTFPTGMLKNKLKKINSILKKQKRKNKMLLKKEKKLRKREIDGGK